jgi:hypothetical protein
MPRGNPDKLIPANKRSKQEASELGRKGGIASGEARREARRWRDFYANVISDQYLTKDEKGELVKQSFDDLSKKAVAKIIEKADSTTIALFREMRQTQDGDVLEINANVSTADVTEGMSYEDKVKAAKEWAKKNL